MDEKIIDKIRKLHAHAESAAKIGSEAEAQAFAQMVNALLNRHRLELSDIQFEEQRKNEPVGQAEINFRQYGDTNRGKDTEWKEKHIRIEWIEKLAGIVARAHSCRILVLERSNRLWLAGTKTNREIAEYVLITLMRAAEKISWDEYCKYYYAMRDEGRVTAARGFRHAFLIGFINRIAQRFDEEKRKMESDNTGTAVVRYNTEARDVAEFVAHNAGPSAKAIGRSTHNSEGLRRGHARANEMNLDANAIQRSSATSHKLTS